MTLIWKRKMPAALMILFLLVFAGSLSQVFAGEPVVAGDSYLTVLQKKGEPDNYVKSGRNELMFYNSSIIELMDGGVVRVDGRQAPSPEAVANQGKEGQNGQGEGKPTPQRIIDVRQQGKAVDIQPLLVEGGYTVVAFYADW